MAPAGIGNADELLDEGDLVGAAGAAHKHKAGLLRGFVPLQVVAAGAGADQILPAVRAAVNFRDDVIHGHLPVVLPAVLAGMAVPLDDVFASQEYPFLRDFDVKPQPDDGGNRKGAGNRTDGKPVGGLHDFRFPHKNQNHCPPYRTDRKWLVVLVEHQYIPRQHRFAHRSVY